MAFSSAIRDALVAYTSQSWIGMVKLGMTRDFSWDASAKQLTGATEGIMKLRGKWLTYPLGPGIRAMAILHPAYLLRNPLAKRLAWRDLLAIRDALDTWER